MTIGNSQRWGRGEAVTTMDGTYGAQSRRIAGSFRYEDIDEGHDHQVAIAGSQRVQGFLSIEICRLMHRQAVFQSQTS